MDSGLYWHCATTHNCAPNSSPILPATLKALHLHAHAPHLADTCLRRHGTLVCLCGLRCRTFPIAHILGLLRDAPAFASLLGVNRAMAAFPTQRAGV